MAFILPKSQYANVEAAPIPTNPNVRLEALPERLLAVRSFSGNLRAERAREQLSLLLADLKTDGWVVDKTNAHGDESVPWQAAGYNAPFVLPWFKTNEVHVPVKPKA